MSIEACGSCKGDGFKRKPAYNCGCREAMCPHFSPFDGDPTERERGIYWKFWVRRTDGSSRDGGKHEACEYFVLDWDHDPFAIPAALAYAEACEAKFPELAADLRRRAKRRREGRRMVKEVAEARAALAGNDETTERKDRP